jgi:hypothetical protein
MREDMFKVIVERPRMRIAKRNGSHYPRGSLKNAWRRDPDEAPKRESLGGAYAYKWLNENLAPLKRYLRSQLGRRWNKVHSEICEQLSMSSAVQKHVLDHLDDFVSTQVEDVGGQLWAADSYGRPRLLQPGWRDTFYVCPHSGLLLVVPGDRVAQRYPWRRTYSPANGEVRVLDLLVELHRLKGIWFEIRFAPVPPQPTGWKVFDVLLRRNVAAQQSYLLKAAHGRPGRLDVFAFSRRQLSKREIQHHLGGGR